VKPSYRALFAVPSIGRILLGIVIARTAGTMSSVVLVLFTLTYFKSPELAGAVTFVSLVPGILVSPLAGALLDRHGRTRLVILDYLVAACAALAIALLAGAGMLTAPLLLLIAFANSLTFPLSASGLRSLLPLIVPRHLWERANAIDSNGYVIATLIGPPAAGALIAFAGGPLALASVGAVYAVAAVVMVGIPDPRSPFESRGGLLADALAGVRYTLRNRTLRGLALAVSVWNIGGGILQILVPVLLINRLQESPAVVGLVWAVSGVAGLFAALFVGRIDTRGRERWLIVWPLFGCAAAYATLLGPPQLLVIVAVLAVIGLMNGPMDVAMFTIRQRRTDPAWMGRAFAVSMALNFAGFPVGSALGGLLVGSAVSVAVVLGTASALLAAFCAWRLIPDRDDADEPTLTTAEREASRAGA
jgi:MFS family permease